MEFFFNKGRVKNKLVEFAPIFAIDLVDLIEQNRRHSSVEDFAIEDRLKMW